MATSPVTRDGRIERNDTVIGVRRCRSGIWGLGKFRLESLSFRLHANVRVNMITRSPELIIKMSRHCWKGTVLRRAESVQNSIYMHKILYIVE